MKAQQLKLLYGEVVNPKLKAHTLTKGRKGAELPQQKVNNLCSKSHFAKNMFSNM